MKYTIRKGLESPCMIRGFLSSDYWIFVGCCAAALILLFLSVRTGIMTGDWTLTLLVPGTPGSFCLAAGTAGTEAQTQEKGTVYEIQGIKVRHDCE